jgi:CTP synthase (EC 6.3.4.2)
VPTDAVFSNPDVDDIYKVPLMVEDEGLDEYVMDRLGIADGAIPKADRSQRWRELVTRERSGSVEIALVGKYGWRTPTCRSTRR